MKKTLLDSDGFMDAFKRSITANAAKRIAPRNALPDPVPPTYPPNSGVVSFRDRDGTIQYRAQWRGRMCSPTWAARGPAHAYLAMLANGSRKPEFEGQS